MGNTTDPLYVGVDLSKSWFDAADADGRARRFDNDPTGHRAFLGWLAPRHARATPAPRPRHARVVVEATGTYGLDLALALHGATHTDVMVVNPRLVKGFATALAQRAKTDRADAQTILRFALAMPFAPWAPPGAAVLELRAMARRIASLTSERAREKNRLHALRASASHSRLVARDIEINIRHLDRRAEQMTAQAVALIGEHTALAKAYGHLTSVRGIAAKSAVALLPELLVLPADMTARQWVAHAGLDPREDTSGSSVRKKARISKMGNVQVRRALFMPAMVASRHEPRVRAFYEELLASGKKPKQAYVAVMRKLLHAIHGMLRDGSDFDGERFRAVRPNVPCPA